MAISLSTVTNQLNSDQAKAEAKTLPVSLTQSCKEQARLATNSMNKGLKLNRGNAPRGAKMRDPVVLKES